MQLVRATEADRLELAELDWHRSLHPAMGGWLVRPASTGFLVRTIDEDELVGVVDAAALAGYDGVTSLSVFIDTARARGGWAFEAYALAVTQLFATGTRLVHHEVLALNQPIGRLLRGVGLTPTARLREHAYAAGRLWDVEVYSFDVERWHHLIERVMPRNPMRSSAPAPVGPAPE